MRYGLLRMAMVCVSTCLVAGCGSVSPAGDTAHLAGRGPRSIVLAGQPQALPPGVFARNDLEMGNIGPAYAPDRGIAYRRISDRQFTTHGRPHDHYSSRTLIFEFEAP